MAQLAIVGLVLLASLGLGAHLLQPASPSSQLRPFSSHAQLIAFLVSQASHPYAVVLPALQSPRAGPQLPFSATNIQVQGVDEPDMAKTDGRYIYIAKGDTIIIASAGSPERMSVQATLKLEGLQARELFVAWNRLLVMGEEPRYCIALFPYRCPQSVAVLLYDISQISSPRLISSVALNGSYVASRLIEGYAYVVALQPAFSYGPRGPIPSLPSYSVNGAPRVLEAQDIYYGEVLSQGAQDYALVLSISLEEGNVGAKALLLGFASTLYASSRNLYIAFPMPPYIMFPLLPAPSSGPQALPVTPIIQGPNTTLVRLSLQGGHVSIAAQGAVPGTLLDQFSLDEKDDHLRVATHLWRAQPEGMAESSAVYVLSMELRVVGALEGISPGESMYAARFVGDVAYLVTFKKVDPVIAISLSDPRDPKIIGHVELPGYSQYLHPLTNGYLLGFGKEAIADPSGQFAWYQGLKVSLFRLDGAKLKELKSFSFGYRGSDSPLLADHRALTQYALPNGTLLLAFPALLYSRPDSPDPWSYGSPAWQGLLLFSFDEAPGLRLVGNITNLPSGPWKGLEERELYIVRAFFVGDHLYALSGALLSAYHLEGLVQVGALKLPP